MCTLLSQSFPSSARSTPQSTLVDLRLYFLISWVQSKPYRWLLSESSPLFCVWVDITGSHGHSFSYHPCSPIYWHKIKYRFLCLTQKSEFFSCKAQVYATVSNSKVTFMDNKVWRSLNFQFSGSSVADSTGFSPKKSVSSSSGTQLDNIT